MCKNNKAQVKYLCDKELNENMFHIRNEAEKWFNGAVKIETSMNNITSYELVICCMKAYACELLIKSIYIYENKRLLEKKEKEHELINLYNSLSNISKKKIKEYTKWNVQRMPSNREQKIVNVKKFGGWIEQISDYFCELRYNYEQYACGKTIFVCEKEITELYKGVLKYSNELYDEVVNNINKN